MAHVNHLTDGEPNLGGERPAPSTRHEAAGFLIVLKEGSAGACTVAMPSRGDFFHTESGLSDINRLSDLCLYVKGGWVQIRPGVLAELDVEDRADSFHVPYDFGSTAPEDRPHKLT
jgi:hypothetical protein